MRKCLITTAVDCPTVCGYIVTFSRLHLRIQFNVGAGTISVAERRSPRGVSRRTAFCFRIHRTETVHVEVPCEITEQNGLGLRTEENDAIAVVVFCFMRTRPIDPNITATVNVSWSQNANFLRTH